jgi:hypothetical protein
MTVRAAIALLTLAVPVLAQHGGARGGSLGGSGFSGHSGFSGSVGISRSGGFARSAPPARYSAPAGAAFRGFASPNYASRQSFLNGSRFAAPHPPYVSSASRSLNRNRFDERRRSFARWYANIYPYGLGYGYPYVFDPGFYDWGDADDSADEQAGMVPEYLSPYPDQQDAGEGPEFAESMPPLAGREISVAPELVPEEPITVVFRGGRAPVKMQNYMMTAKVLIDLDSHHYERIPLEQIDLPATQQANSAAGVDFQVPGA